jgi:peptidoglycan/LPS O-acetylase OafA/YrhL
MPAPITANSSSPARRTYFPGLDGLRGIAFLMIFCFHYLPPVVDLPGVRWGWIGVDLFFVLSGFLITGILYDSLSSHTFFKTFYIRRSLRIFPSTLGSGYCCCLRLPGFTSSGTATTSRSSCTSAITLSPTHRLHGITSIPSSWHSLRNICWEVLLASSPSPTSGRSRSRSSSTASGLRSSGWFASAADC